MMPDHSKQSLEKYAARWEQRKRRDDAETAIKEALAELKKEYQARAKPLIDKLVQLEALKPRIISVPLDYPNDIRPPCKACGK